LYADDIPFGLILCRSCSIFRYNIGGNF